MIKTILPIILFFSLTVISSCSDDNDDNIDKTLIGTWSYDGGTATFNTDGTATLKYQDGDIESFNWSAKGNILTVSYTESGTEDGIKYSETESEGGYFIIIDGNLFYENVFINKSATEDSLDGRWLSVSEGSETGSEDNEQFEWYETTKSTLKISGDKYMLTMKTTEKWDDPQEGGKGSESFTETVEGTINTDGTNILCIKEKTVDKNGVEEIYDDSNEEECGKILSGTAIQFSYSSISSSEPLPAE